MREYSITRSTMEWQRILTSMATDGTGPDVDALIDDIRWMLNRDDTHGGVAYNLPYRIERKD